MLKNLFLRYRDSGIYLDTLFIFAAGTILVTRLYLEFTNYPKIGGGSLHIAHMLWGGLLLLVSVILLLSFVNKKIFRIAAVLAGIGFGLFIDELGKFITNDNNYFFEPTIAVIYVIFILLYLTSKFIEDKLPVAPEENEGGIELFPFLKSPRRLLSLVIKRKWFDRSVVVFFIIFSLYNLYKASDVLSLYFRLNEFTLSVFEVGQLVSAVLASIIVVVGIVRFGFSRSWGYRMFKIAILISIFLTQFFDFYNHQLNALYPLVFNILVLFVLQYILKEQSDFKNK